MILIYFSLLASSQNEEINESLEKGIKLGYIKSDLFFRKKLTAEGETVLKYSLELNRFFSTLWNRN